MGAHDIGRRARRVRRRGKWMSNRRAHGAGCHPETKYLASPRCNRAPHVQLLRSGLRRRRHGCRPPGDPCMTIEACGVRRAACGVRPTFARVVRLTTSPGVGRVLAFQGDAAGTRRTLRERAAP